MPDPGQTPALSWSLALPDTTELLDAIEQVLALRGRVESDLFVNGIDGVSTEAAFVWQRPEGVSPTPGWEFFHRRPSGPGPIPEVAHWRVKLRDQRTEEPLLPLGHVQVDVAADVAVGFDLHVRWHGEVRREPRIASLQVGVTRWPIDVVVEDPADAGRHVEAHLPIGWQGRASLPLGNVWAGDTERRDAFLLAARASLIAMAVLDAAGPLGFEVAVQDPAGFHESRDPAALADAIRICTTDEARRAIRAEELLAKAAPPDVQDYYAESCRRLAALQHEQAPADWQDILAAELALARNGGSS